MSFGCLLGLGGGGDLLFYLGGCLCIRGGFFLRCELCVVALFYLVCQCILGLVHVRDRELLLRRDVELPVEESV